MCRIWRWHFMWNASNVFLSHRSNEFECFMNEFVSRLLLLPILGTVLTLTFDLCDLCVMCKDVDGTI